MNYFWTFCPKCSCQLTIQYVEHPEQLVGSTRRWSTDRTVNDGKRLEIPRAAIAADGGFPTTCVCGQAIDVKADQVEHATTERPAV